MKRKNLFTLLILIILLSYPIYVYASDKGTVTSNLKIRTCPSTTCDTLKDSDGTNTIISTGTLIDILDTVDSNNPTGDTCNAKWYKIDNNGREGYICSSYVEINSESSEEPIQPSSVTLKYEVIAYGTHSSEGRVAIIKLKDGYTDDISCDQYKVLIDNKVSCVTSATLKNITSVSILNTSNINYDFEAELAKFPTSYQSYLRTIHQVHPTWRFYAYNTGLDWNEAVNTEKNATLISGDNTSYRDVYEGVNYNWKTNTWIAHEAGSWFTPSKVATAYYLDPRTYLQIDNLGSDGYDYKRIFVFEDSRAYTYHNSLALKQMIVYGGINTSFTTSDGLTKTYEQAFTDGAVFSKISALTLIARSRNETAKFTSNSVTGTYINPDTKVDYSGYYNYFNVGSFGSAPVSSGLAYAQKVGWNDRYKSIVEGSIFIGTKYVYNGQETQYFQKFNVSPNRMYAAYDHQYQTNIEAPITEAGFVFWGYKDSGNIELPIVFHIPVYNNMPTTLSIQPKDGNPNNWLTDLKIDGKTIDNFDGDSYYSYDDNWDGIADDTFSSNVYSYTVPYDQDTINISTTTAVSTSNVTGNGIITVDKSKTINIVVTAENGTTKTYVIKLTKQDAPETDESGEIIYPEITEILNNIGIKYNDKYMSGLNLGTTFQTLEDAITKKSNLVKTSVIKNSNNQTNYLTTGDVIKITSGSKTNDYTYVLYGDLNGDGAINLSDLVNCRNMILGISNLTGANKEASDINKNGQIDLSDLVSIRNHILGTLISQQ